MQIKIACLNKDIEGKSKIIEGLYQELDEIKDLFCSEVQISSDLREQVKFHKALLV